MKAAHDDDLSKVAADEPAVDHKDPIGTKSIVKKGVVEVGVPNPAKIDLMVVTV